LLKKHSVVAIWAEVCYCVFLTLLENGQVQNESWVYQGRQAHGWFGSGTAPRDAAPEPPGGGAPPSLAERVAMVAGAAVAEVPRERRARFEAQLHRGMLGSLAEAMPAWVPGLFKAMGWRAF
jgi:hypothetical protein